MKTKAVRMYGADDLRLEEFELPQIKEDEILVKVVSDSICMSTYKLIKQGKKHKRVPQNIETNPIIVGHEFAGDIVQVGAKWQSEFHAGEKFAQQPALNYKGSLASPGYSYEWFGGDCTYCILPHEVMELGCLLHYNGDSYFEASLGEPMSCIIGGFHSNYHTSKISYEHTSGVKENGAVLIMGGAGPMGLGAVEYALCIEKKPRLVVVTDVSEERLARARQVVTEARAAMQGVVLKYVNPETLENQNEGLKALTGDKGFDDIFVMAPIRPLVEQADSLLAFDGCLNFFAGPSDKNFSASINMYNTHYISTHIMGSTGGNTDDLVEAVNLAAEGKINPSVMVTHIGGIDCIAETTRNLPNIPGGKKLIYTQINLPLIAIEDFKTLGDKNELFRQLADSCDRNNGLWNNEAEHILLQHFGTNG